MDFVQSAGLTGLFLTLSFWLYHKVSGAGNEAGIRWMLKLFILLCGLLLFINVNLCNSARIQIQTSAVIEKYMIPSTLDLISTVHDPNNRIQMEENRIHVNPGTDKEKIFLLMRAPFFGIIDQSKSTALSKELGEIR